MIFHNSTRKIFFQNIKIKLNSRTWMTLKSSVVIFQALKPLQSQWPLQPQRPPWPQWPLQPHFMKKNNAPDGWILPGNQMTNIGPFLWNGSSKIQIFTDICSLSVRGCWGQLMLLFLKLVDEAKISKPQDLRTTFKQILACIFLSVRPKLLVTFQYEIHCIILK